MTGATDTHVLLRAFTDELARCGLAGACTSPGSRSTPLVLSLVRDGRIRCWSHVDERAAGFFALGAAKRSRRPVALVCTSGTAAAHYLPAVIEAYEARVPLLVLTADRPPELREVGAGQTIDQIRLYGSATKWFFEVGTHDATPERARWMRTLACRAYWTALEGRPGPVHLNFPLREPLVLDEPLPEEEPGGGGRPDGKPWVTLGRSLTIVPEGSAGRGRGVIVAGREERRPRLPAAIDAFARAAGWPVLADPLSGTRRGPAAVAHYDALLRDEGFAQAHRPEAVLRIGDLPTSKPLREWLASLDGVPQVALDPDGAWQDPAGVLAEVQRADPEFALKVFAREIEASGPAPPEWLTAWRDADARAARAIAEALGDALSEPQVAARLGARLPANATLVVASSMPVRDVETFFPLRDDPPRLLSNRGANGIDGTLSTALGAAAAGRGPVAVLLGDVALAHDAGGLLAAARLGLAITVVLVDNGGGGIFDFLPVASQRDAFEEHIATPTGLDVGKLAATYGCEHVAVADLAAFDAAVVAALEAPRTTIVHVRTERAANVALHRDIWSSVFAALRGAP